jgi:hypothetical protein
LLRCVRASRFNSLLMALSCGLRVLPVLARSRYLIV